MMEPKQDAIGEALMMTILDVAKALQCSDRHVTKLRQEKRMPEPVQLGNCVRWPRKQIEGWIDAGCPPTLAV